ncbi:hypothetical protein [Helcococcus massiliensis]|uniref:hypothetical protein n=1 Tax=Helcococcus massiliensis TaxID=2040290 RepID=UPI000CDE889B|nr:hypothetical protein [Helcococcus massiliensis]
MKKKLFILLSLTLLLTACKNNTANDNKETAKETRQETNNEGMTKAQGVYLGNGFFAEETVFEGKTFNQLIQVHTPEGTNLELGKFYEYEYDGTTSSLPIRTSVEKIEALALTKVQKISEDTANEILDYVENSKAIYKETDKKLEKSEEITDESLDQLDRKTVMIVYGKDSAKLVETLKEKGFEIILEMIE